MRQMRPAELKAWLDDPARDKPFLLDVREPWEYDICRIEGSRLVPMRSIEAQLANLDRERETVCICHHGVRSYHVARYLEHHGFNRVINLAGGVDAWAKEADSKMPTY